MTTPFDAERIAELHDLNEERAAASRSCPVRTNRRLLPDGSCPKCRATANQGCGPADNVEYRIAECVREAFREKEDRLAIRQHLLEQGR